jgi:hypothetical protein
MTTTGGQDEKHNRLGKGGHAFELAVTVMMFLVRRLVCSANC